MTMIDMKSPKDSLQISKERAAEIRKRYQESPKVDKCHCSVLGVKGKGKTSLIETGPFPALVHSFDPAGTTVLDQKLIEEGKILVDNRFEDDDMRDPRAYLLWEREMHGLIADGFFHNIAAFYIDSMTTLSNSAIWQILKKERQQLAAMDQKSDRKKQGMQVQDWGTNLNLWIEIARMCGTLPCHTFMMGHIGKTFDQALQTYVRTIALPGQASDQVPINLSEVWVLDQTRDGERYLLTQNEGDYLASTRIGKKGLFDKHEKPDIRYLLKKAGLNAEDKPLLV